MLGLLLLCSLCYTGADWQTAQPAWNYIFPQDHRSHPQFKTEWWYFTGNVFDSSGARFGYEITFFREGIRTPAERGATVSRFVVDDLKFAHFAVTDANGRRFRFEQKTSRGAFGEAGFDDGDRVAWIDHWSLTLDSNGDFNVAADSAEVSARLHLHPLKPPAIHGENGVSIKASGEGHASQYYSITRLETRGELRLASVAHSVAGESWFDHEWATNQLAPGQIGWNWVGLQFSDGSELMLYQMRLEKGETDPTSSGALIEPDGRLLHLNANDYRMTPTRFWKSKTTGASYPVAWRIEIPAKEIKFTIAPVLENQELTLGALTYWEGAIDLDGTRSGAAISGRGYLELTGYAVPLKALIR